MRRCDDCGYRFYPNLPCCPHCRSNSLEWMAVAGEGRIHTYQVLMQSTLAAFRKAVPYVVAIVELDDCANPDGTAVRLPGVIDAPPEEIGINACVRAQFAAEKDGPVYPTFTVTGRGADFWRFADVISREGRDGHG